MLFQHNLLLSGKIALVSIIYGGNAVIESLVERNVVTMLAEHRNGLIQHCVKSITAVSLRNIVKHTAHFGKNLARKFKRGYGVLKSRSFRIGDDSVYLLVLLLNSRLECRNIIRHLYLVERRYAKRGVPFRKERICSVAASGHNQCKCKK